MILVTGGTGLVGSHLLYNLCEQGEIIRVIKRSSSKLDNVKKVFSYYSSEPENLLEKINWVDADLLDVYSLMEAMEGVDEVYHCAATVSFAKKDVEEMKRVNVEGTTNVVNAALEMGVKKLCHVSSIATIGNIKEEKLSTEKSPWKSSPELSNYSITKYAAEREVWRASEEGLNVVIVNPSLIIGPGNWQQSSSNMFNKGYHGLKFYSSGETGFVDVRDVATLMVKLMQSEVVNERFILNSENKSYRWFFDVMHKAFNKPFPTIKAGKLLSSFAWRAESVRCFFTGNTPLITKETALSAHHVQHYSNQKIKSLFPDFNFISVEQSIKDTCELYLKDC